MVRNSVCVCWVRLEAVALPQQLGKGIPASEGGILPYYHLLIAAPALWSKATEPDFSETGYHKAGAGYGQTVQVVRMGHPWETALGTETATQRSSNSLGACTMTAPYC